MPEKTLEELAMESAKKSIPMLDKIVWLCVAMGVVITVFPMAYSATHGETLSDSYYQYSFNFWGGELIANVVIYAIKTLVTVTGNKIFSEAENNDASDDECN